MVKYIKNYPRPQLLREDFELLDGVWGFGFDDNNEGEKNGWSGGFDKSYDITVPFTYETKKSGIGDETVHENVWYQRELNLTEEWAKNHTLIHFEGSDYITKLWVNGIFIGTHRGGYSRFSFDISNAVAVGKNKLVVKVEDSLDDTIPRGKQRWAGENFGCWYVQTTGIWKSVWVENVAASYIESIKITPDVTEGCVVVEGKVNGNGQAELFSNIEVNFKDEKIARVCVEVNRNEFYAKIPVSAKSNPWGVYHWSPEEPNLYDLKITLKSEKENLDEAYSYFGMREIRIRGRNILLNGKPLYQRLILDQGYWEDSHLTPPSEEALVEDIDKIMALGYNGLRKHQKVEDERFLYHCDVKGMLVWSEMPSAYRYNDDAVEAFTTEWLSVVRQNYNHPCIITWTPINESWGVKQVETDYKQQKFTETIYNLTKSIDDMRPVIVNDGWEHTVSDIFTLHDYEETGEAFYNRYIKQDELLNAEIYHNGFKSSLAQGYGYKGQPVIISEYGGIAFSNEQVGWGYGNKVGSEEEFIKRFDSITSAIKKLDYICGFCYTQVTDVQQEINGLMDIKRNYKVDCKSIKEINLR